MIEKLETLPYFTLSQLALFYKDKKTASVVVSNKLRQKKFLSIREWIYISEKKLLEISLSNKMTPFIEFISTNLIYTPSYISWEYVLFENNIITENVYTVTLVTTNKTANFHNTFWTFIYKSIKDTFFWDYKTIKSDDFLIYKASPEKALFDYLYFKRWVVFNQEYVEELRLNLENINFTKFEEIINKYPSKKMKNIFKLLKKIKW